MYVVERRDDNNSTVRAEDDCRDIILYASAVSQLHRSGTMVGGSKRFDFEGLCHSFIMEGRQSTTVGCADSDLPITIQLSLLQSWKTRMRSIETKSSAIADADKPRDR